MDILTLKPKKAHKIEFKRPIKRFSVYDLNKNLVYERFFENKQKNIEFNLPYYQPETKYVINTGQPYNIINFSISEIKLPNIKTNINPNKQKVKVLLNYNLKGTPARIFVKEKVIEVSAFFISLPRYQKEFILLHELSHFNNIDEAKTDLNALYYYIKGGHNFTQAIETHNKILNSSPLKIQRLENIYKKSLKR